MELALTTRRDRKRDLNEPIEPFLRWAGGKRRLVSKLLRFLPDDVADRRYHEPFLGAGSLFLALQPERATLSDANEHLISCYAAIRRQPEQVYSHLRRHGAASCEAHYYKIRDQYNRSAESAAQAARFIYLNKTCFNGIFRVNMHGAFNVPYGHKEPPLLPTRDELRRASTVLQSCRLQAATFEDSLDGLGKRDFVYLDPPYPPLNGTSYFTHYTRDRFGEEDQRKLAAHVATLSRRGARFMMSNADTPLIRQLYGAFRIMSLSVTRYITCKAKKHRVAELLITNYPVRPHPHD